MGIPKENILIEHDSRKRTSRRWAVKNILQDVTTPAQCIFDHLRESHAEDPLPVCQGRVAMDCFMPLIFIVLIPVVFLRTFFVIPKALKHGWKWSTLIKKMSGYVAYWRRRLIS